MPPKGLEWVDNAEADQQLSLSLKVVIAAATKQQEGIKD